jgi:RsiW-degrading membrane proteinase PrsW (M82 family)
VSARLPPPVRVTSSSVSPPAGWYADPVRGRGWRWWNGSTWTHYTEEWAGVAATTAKPRGPRWLSIPVLVCAPLVLIGIVVLAVIDAVSVLAGLVPLAIVLPVITWLDRVEPEPRASRAHALLWGASVAIVGGLVCNTATALLAGDVAAMVVSAPVAEEAFKALGVVWAVRRREVDGVSDGIVYAAWVALGFAVVEDMTYFAQGSIDGAFTQVFVLRALLTPFAHPLFTFWTGLAVGLAVRRRRPLFPSALWGYLLAVGTHMLWNGSLAFGDITTDVDEDVATTVIVGALLLFFVLFVAVMVTLIVMRRREAERFIAGVPAVVRRHGIPPDEAQVFASWRAVVETRRRLPRRRRKDFDAFHAAVARLVALDHRRPVDPADEHVLGDQLHHARSRLRS